MQRTRVVKLKTGKVRQDAPNSATVVLELPAGGLPRPFKDLFVENYGRIRDVCEEYKRRGLAIVAADNSGVAGTACISAKKGRVNAAIIGRHGMTDLYLESDPALSLRHLAVLLHPLQDGEDLRFRVLDLRTGTAFCDEHGRRLEAIEAEGPVFVRCGSYTLFFIPTEEEGTPWPEDADAGWQCIPERVYLNDAPAEPDRWLRRKLQALWGGVLDEPADKQRRRTIVQTVRGPARACRRLVDDDDEPLGELQIFSGDSESTIVIGKSAARAGILFGRYERCDNDGLPVLSNPRISRVHLLLIEVLGTVYAIDTASINGVWRDEEEVRLTVLQPGQKLRLGDNLASLHWRLSH